MAAQVFAYIEHKNGVSDDTALELISAAQDIYPDSAVTAIVTGSGADLDAVCNEMAAFYKEVWKFDNEALAYPNAEAIRKLTSLPADNLRLRDRGRLNDLEYRSNVCIFRRFVERSLRLRSARAAGRSCPRGRSPCIDRARVWSRRRRRSCLRRWCRRGRP